MMPRMLDLGDTAITVEFGNRIEPAILARVAALDHACQHEIRAGRLPGIIETVPTFRSLTVIFDPLVTSRTALLPALETLLAKDGKATSLPGRRWRLPVCYEGDHAPDLASVSERTGLSRDALVELHAGGDYVVYMLGFLPGFPFMGDLPENLHLPRRAEPRVSVPPGSVAIATGLTAIYPWESPGGWHLLGNCPVPLFDAARGEPALFAAGDHVSFTPVSLTEHIRLRKAAAGGEIDPGTWKSTDA